MRRAGLLWTALALAASSLALVPRVARADGPSDAGAAHAITVTTAAAVHVRSHNRPVRIVGWSRAEVKVTGGGALSVQVSEDHGRVSVIAGPQDGSAPIELSVPAASAVDVRTISGDVAVSDVTGEVRVGSVNAAIRVKGAPKQVEADTVSGTVDLDLSACDVRTSSVGGAVRLQCRGKSARVHAKSVSAPISVTAATVERLELRSVSGTVDADAKVAGDGPFELRSHSGTVTLSVPKGTPLVVDARSRGRIEVKASAPDAGPATTAPTVTLRTFSGDIRVLEK
jgi:Putative adhesin